MTIQQAVDRLIAAAELIPEPAPAALTISPSGAVAQLEEEVGSLVETLSEIETLILTALPVLQQVAEELDEESLSDRLTDFVETARSQVSQQLASDEDEFDGLFEEMEELADQLQDWLTSQADELEDALAEALSEVDSCVEQGLERLSDTAEASIRSLGEDVTEGVANRCKNAGRDIVEAVIDRAVNEVAETLLTTQMGATITSSIGPYLPAVIALRPALPLIQRALDLMRGGM